ncbi:Protein phosphatase [Mycena sanguinolenta]|uniref:Protein phosphatase n=1 Tax=Mycena sanguinolenta TaxID=230812 RepID=A0A8H6YNW8_9AGAR|nr:Protein phosphatase [Mycena sanguinolenta]
MLYDCGAKNLSKGSHPIVRHAVLAKIFFLCTNMRNNSGISLGLSDGVGGWVDQGIDCSLFSQGLMYYAHRRLENGWAGEPEVDPIIETASDSATVGAEVTPSEVLQFAYRDVLRDPSIEAGSSTACLLTLNASSGMLRSANLGDSGFCIVPILTRRASSMFFSSRPQTHFFNCPRQLAKLKSIKDKATSFSDLPDTAEEYSTRLKDGDVVIAYTDGLSDNIFPAEILTICSLIMNKPDSETTKVQMLAQSLVNHSRNCMFSDQVSPFEIDARRHRQRWQGGKIDDVTVVVALVQETP